MDEGRVSPTIGYKRKSISLNAKGPEAQSSLAVFQDTVQWDSVTAISREEKKELRKRLMLQLEQLEDVSLKIAARQEQLLKGPGRSFRGNNDGSVGKEVVSTVILEGRLARQLSVIGAPGFSGKEKRTPKANQLYLNSEFISGKVKLPRKDKVKRKGRVGAKRGHQGKVDGRDPKRAKIESARCKRLANIMKLCSTMLKKLFIHKHAWVFSTPVDTVKLCLHDYHKVIKNPMDLGTIKNRLDENLYASPYEFADDVRLTFINAMTYNPPGHAVHLMAEVLQKQFEERWEKVQEKMEEYKLKQKIEDEYLATGGQGSSEQYNDLKQHLRCIKDKIHSLVSTKANRSIRGRQAKPKPGDKEKRPMTFDEQKKLNVALESLPRDKMEHALTIIKTMNQHVNQKENEIEVDITFFDNDTLWELDRLVTNWAKSKHKRRAKQTNQTIQSQHIKQEQLERGTRETQRKVEKGDEVEDVDIDDDDLDPVSYELVVIDKDPGDTLPTNSSSSSNSSSDSESSCDSDSESPSSSSDSNGEELKSPEVNVTEKGNLPFEVDVAKSSVDETLDDILSVKESSPVQHQLM